MAKRTVLFLCPHNAAKSIMAAAYFERLANQNNLDFCATSAGTAPDDATAPAVVDRKDWMYPHTCLDESLVRNWSVRFGWWLWGAM
jgi:predicted protein tyrosine phosphatase